MEKQVKKYPTKYIYIYIIYIYIYFLKLYEVSNY